MNAFFATLHKEILLLLRDRSGLALLFIMPMALVLVVSLVQDNVLKLTEEGSIRVLLIDRDDGELGRRLAEGLWTSGAVQGAFRSTVVNALQRVALVLEVEEKGRLLGEVLPQQVAEQIEKSSGFPRHLPGAP